MALPLHTELTQICSGRFEFTQKKSTVSPVWHGSIQITNGRAAKITEMVPGKILFNFMSEVVDEILLPRFHLSVKFKASVGFR